MIVIHRMEVTDAERSALSLRLHPKALKRLATGNEIKQYQCEGWSKITAPDQSESLQISNNPVGSPKPFPIVPFGEEDAPEKPTVDNSNAPKTGLRPALASINNAMFSLANARRQLDQETWAYVLKKAADIVDDVEALRDTVVELHDEEYADK